MFIERLLPLAREWLVTIPEDAPPSQAPDLSATQADLVKPRRTHDRRDHAQRHCAPCRRVREGSPGCGGFSHDARCRALPSNDTLGSVWERMQLRKRKNIPVVEAESRPVGVLYARDLLQVLLRDSEDEESMLRGCGIGVGD